MKILVCATEEQQQEIKNDLLKDENDLFFCSVMPEDVDSFDAFFLLNDSCNSGIYESDSYRISEKVLLKGNPIFINEVVRTLSEINASENVIRINGWPGFLNRPVWEAAGKIDETARDAVKMLGREIIKVKDVPGLVAASVISMIINEAYFAKKENISSEEEIDMAMKLGTNYPFGPFEWANRIGIKNIYDLLEKLSVQNPRYKPSFLP